MAAKSDMDGINAQINQKQWLNDRNQVRAPFDGIVGVINIAEGSRTGNLHLFDTDRKFVEMRVSDQTYRYIEQGQFAEFFVNSHPGEVFRGRVHSITSNTGEATVSAQGSTQHVRQHVGITRAAMAVQSSSSLTNQKATTCHLVPLVLAGYLPTSRHLNLVLWTSLAVQPFV
ncbi:multidrug resistance efflux pump [Vibrio maritimus]|uniref:Multidrug resistance efflux pump n=1 Tax=Vibrio maritimus TaxID=990268 RepID=A0A090SVJ3_9VIBR|nr:multidrug resistance efflux pump [Vibrio maritimus]